MQEAIEDVIKENNITADKIKSFKAFCNKHIPLL